MNPTALILRYVARIWSIASWLFVLAFVVGGRESLRPAPSEILGLLFFPVGVLVGFAISWRREAAGACVSLVSLAGFFAWMTMRDGYLRSGAGWFIVLAGPAFLFLGSALLNKMCTTEASPSS